MSRSRELAELGTAYDSGSSFGFKNRIINGDCRIDQRNAGASVTPTDGQYTLDRWTGNVGAASKYSVQQNAGAVTPPAGFVNYLGVTSLSSYSVGAGESFAIRQAVEGFNISDFGWGTANAQPVTLSFWVRSSLTGTFGGTLRNSAVNRSYPFVYTISAANTWEQKTINVAGDTSGTWLTTNGAGVYLTFAFGVGSTFSGTAGAWASANYVSATGATSVVGTSGATFYITGVQLEAGSVATPFERRDYGRELMMCQRYYEKSFAQGVAPSNGASATTLSTTDGSVVGISQNRLNAGPTVFFKATKRALPTITKYGNSSGDWVYALQNSNSWVGSSNLGFPRVGDGSFVTDQQVIDATTIFVTGHWTASAEL